jgi:hypothetical protein
LARLLQSFTKNICGGKMKRVLFIIMLLFIYTALYCAEENKNPEDKYGIKLEKAPEEYEKGWKKNRRNSYPQPAVRNGKNEHGADPETKQETPIDNSLRNWYITLNIGMGMNSNTSGESQSAENSGLNFAYVYGLDLHYVFGPEDKDLKLGFLVGFNARWLTENDISKFLIGVDLHFAIRFKNFLLSAGVFMDFNPSDEIAHADSYESPDQYDKFSSPIFGVSVNARYLLILGSFKTYFGITFRMDLTKVSETYDSSVNPDKLLSENKYLYVGFSYGFMF